MAIKVRTYRLATPLGTEVAPILQAINDDPEAKCSLLLNDPKPVWVEAPNGHTYVVIPEGVTLEPVVEMLG